MHAVGEVFILAERHARRLRNPYVGTEHLLLALVAGRDSEPARILTSLGVRLDWLRDQIEAGLADQVSTGPLPADLPYTSHLAFVVEAAMKEAAPLGHDSVDSRHLLLGLMTDTRSVPTRKLRRLGATLDDARSIVRGAGPRRAPLQIKMDDTSDAKIYEQIIAQIQEAVATERVVPGDRLPTVRQLADELGIAPGTVARAYAELEESGAIISEGTRGTFVAIRRRPSGSKSSRTEGIRALLRPVVVAAYHQGASADEVRTALERAMMDILGNVSTRQE
jgi:DNA-binding transcriptional regulator YhcF (GntR family)